MKPTKSIYILLSLFLMFSCDHNSVEPLVCDEGLTEVEGECLDECGEVNGDNSTCTDECGVVNGNTIEECGSCDYVYLWGECYNIEETTELIFGGLFCTNGCVTGEIPPEIGNLTNLTTLNLYRNELIGEIPSEIGNLTKLETLSLYSNQLDGEIPVSIGNMKNLSDLSLFNNQLTGHIPESICLINNNFNYLNISNNFLCPPYPTCIENDVGTQDTSNCP